MPKQNRNCQCFGLFRFEPKEKKSVSQDTLLWNRGAFGSRGGSLEAAQAHSVVRGGSRWSHGGQSEPWGSMLEPKRLSLDNGPALELRKITIDLWILRGTSGGSRSEPWTHPAAVVTHTGAVQARTFFFKVSPCSCEAHRTLQLKRMPLFFINLPGIELTNLWTLWPPYVLTVCKTMRENIFSSVGFCSTFLISSKQISTKLYN